MKAEARVEAADLGKVEIPETLALLPVRDLVLFPYMIVPLLVSRPFSAAAVDLALGGTRDRLIFVTVQHAEQEDCPSPSGLHEVGTVATILRMRKLADGRMKILIQGLFRARVTSWLGSVPCHTVHVEQVFDRPEGSADRLAGDPYGPLATAEIEALARQIKDDLDAYARAGKVSSPELLSIMAGVEEPGRLADLVCANLHFKVDEGQRVLEELDPLRRLRVISEKLRKEMEIIHMQEIIQARAKEVLSRSQREHYLREQLRQIHSELGGDEGSEARELRARLAEAGLSGEAMEEAERQLRRLEATPQSSAEYQVIRTYLEWLAEVPWRRATEDQLDLLAARQILDEDHHDLSKVKDRILEFLSVMRLRQRDGQAQGGPGGILCFVGPPGVGKTSLGRSIARALGRRFVRVALGGVREEAEIRGHRRTYVGALPGRLIQGMRQAGVKNPVVMLDEIDKIGAEGQGDPAAALLEVLDPEQNSAFRDHYLGVPYDLSGVLFLATANATDRIPQALRDRLEVIRLSGYTEEEKLHIATKYVLPRTLSLCGLKGSVEVRFTRDALRRLISDYTREAGLREMERQIAAVCRKLARQTVEEEDTRRSSASPGPAGATVIPILPVLAGRKRSVKVDQRALGRYLGPPLFKRHVPPGGAHARVGVALGLAWTPVGGEVLEIETQLMPGRGQLTLTGQLGEVMRESAQAALSFARAYASSKGRPGGNIERQEIHIHVPQGAVQKDGPSAGVTMACALVSLLTRVPVRAGVAMTGELSLRGRVLPVGGLKEKLLAALRAGLEVALVPSGNQRDLEELPRSVRRGLNIILVDTMEDVLREALMTRTKRQKARRRAE